MKGLSDRQEDGLLVALQADVETVVSGVLRLGDEPVTAFGGDCSQRRVDGVDRLLFGK